MEKIAEAFRRQFAHWGLELPAPVLRERRPGFIQAQGWLIQYTFGRNRWGEYLNYYASHRMTDDSHVRLYASGRCQQLSALVSVFFTSQDPANAERLEAAYYRRNGRVARLLVAKGFDKFTMNMALHAGLDQLDESTNESSVGPNET